MNQRWFLVLEPYREFMSIVQHGNADGLSRLRRKCGSETCPDCNIDPTGNPIIGERLSDEESLIQYQSHLLNRLHLPPQNVVE